MKRLVLVLALALAALAACKTAQAVVDFYTLGFIDFRKKYPSYDAFAPLNSGKDTEDRYFEWFDLQGVDIRPLQERIQSGRRLA